jgi:Tfp pilus assembly PilM family ATPase
MGLIECGCRVTLLALFNKGSLCLVRKFNMGGEALVGRIQKQMDVAREVAEGIVSDGSFDISQAVQDVIDPFLRQLSISKDFVERREGCHISSLHVSGGMGLSRYWVERIRAAAGVEVLPWNPMSNLQVAEGAIPEQVVGQEARLAAAVGVAAGAFEEA